MTPQALTNWTTQWITQQGLTTSFSIVPLAGDGSTRQFFRLSLSTSPATHFVLLFDPAWHLSRDYGAHQSYLKNTALPVPNFLAIDPKAGILVMEDLGDELLQNRIEKDPQSKINWLQKSIQILAKLHGETFPVSPNIPASTRRFDAKKYFEELSFTIEHLQQNLLGLGKASSSLSATVQNFCQTLERLTPEVFSHRDYHCRNLLLKNEHLYMIDFQDARLGPPHYDLASLVYDAYVPITSSERTLLVALYKKEVERYALADAIDWNGFENALTLVGLQRTLKAAGSFASFFTRSQKKTHLKYLVPALHYSILLRNSLPSEMTHLIQDLPLEKWIQQFQSLKIIEGN